MSENYHDDTIFVIVENIPAITNGEDDTHECICVHLGYFTDENVAEAKVNKLNKEYLAELRDENGEEWEPSEDDETRFGFIPVEPENTI